MSTGRAPRITRDVAGNFAVELGSRASYEYVGWFPSFDEACDWSDANRRFFWTFIERIETFEIISDPPSLSGPHDAPVLFEPFEKRKA